MAESAALRHLRENAGKYPKEELVKQLRVAGYPEAEIASAVLRFEKGNSVAAAPSGDFFDFKTPRVYTSVGQKIGDFVTGFFGYLVFSVLSSFLFYSLFRFAVFGAPFALRFFPGLLSFGIAIAAIIYLWKRRRWVCYGMISLLLVSVSLAFLGLGVLYFLLRALS